jgi:purine-binding chemotaxis protein CheW
MGSEESFQSGDSLATGRAADEFPSQVKKTPEAPAQIEVDVPSNARAADDSGAESQMPSAQLLALFKFQAMGVHFAVPAEQYVDDFPCAEDISSDQDGPEWVLGEIAIDGKRIRIANIAVMVIPNTRRDALRSDFRYRRVLQVGRGGWGFVCDGDVERIELSFEKVHWRTKQGKRQWLAGTIVDQKCALLDVSVIERVLDHGEWGE